jgi:BirA family biotin operon repressor/biotin-[acetyl-CoA-carboxylase] ligase
MTIPWPVVRLDEVESTNDLARQLALAPDSPSPCPIVLRADRQTRGRGRGMNSWWSDEGSLTFSVLLDPVAIGLEDRHTPLSSLATALAVVDAIAPRVASGSIRIRWPNDVEIDGRKVCGILPERVNSPAGPRLIIGIGLNVRSRLDDAPDEVRRMAASLAEFADPPPTADDQEAIFAALLGGLEHALALLSRDDPGLARRWTELDQLRGLPVRVDLGAEVVSGIGCGIGPDGGLRVEIASGERILYGGRVLREG